MEILLDGTRAATEKGKIGELKICKMKHKEQ